jgi:uroporphyrin-III C-methyltransferase
MSSGKAYLIGAGPGDPELLTLRAARALGECKLVLVDELVHRDVLAHARGARVLHVGRRCGKNPIPLHAVTRVLVDAVRAGAIAARLKGGDPFVFGRGGEEALALAREGLAFEIVPGVTAALGAAAYAGIPLTYRGVASSVAFVAGHRAADRELRAVDVAADTVVVYMCERTIVGIARDLVIAGRAPTTSCAIVRGATWAAQEVYVGTLDELAALPADWHAALDPAPATLAIVGDVVRFAAVLAWCGRSRAIAELAPVRRAAAVGGAR